MPSDPVSDALKSAKQTLANANKLTESVEGNSTSTFAPKEPSKPRIPQAPHPANAGYGLAAEARSAAEGIKAKSDTISEYVKAK